MVQRKREKERERGEVRGLIFFIIFGMGVSHLHQHHGFQTDCSKRCLKALIKLIGSNLHFKTLGETQQYLRFARYHMKYQLEEVHSFKIRLHCTSSTEIRFWGKLYVKCTAVQKSVWIRKAESGVKSESSVLEVKQYLTSTGSCCFLLFVFNATFDILAKRKCLLCY